MGNFEAMTAPLDEKGLLPCPFCGGEPSVSTYETESLWSHDQVTYTKVECPECDIAFNSEPGYEVEAPDAWNRRAYLAASSSPSEMEVVSTAWEGYWPGAGSISSTTKLTKDKNTAARWQDDGAEIESLVRASQAQSALAAMRAERIEAERDALSFAGKLKAAESQVLRLTEENEALRKELHDWQNGHSKSVRAHAEALGRIKALEEALNERERELSEIQTAQGLPSKFTFKGKTYLRRVTMVRELNGTTTRIIEVLSPRRGPDAARTTLQKEQADGK